MPLHFRCPCGTVLAADDGSAEKGGQCPSCGKVVIVPEQAAAITSEELGPAAPAPEAPLAPAEAAAVGEVVGAPAAGACPDCGSALEPGAVLCVQCGLNLLTGEKVSAAAGAVPAAAEADFAEPPEIPAELPADGFEPVPGEAEPVEEPDGLKAAAIQALAELDDIGEEAPARGRRGRARPVEKKKGGLLGKLIVFLLILLVLAAGAFVAVVYLAPHLLPDSVRALLKAYGIVKPGRVP